MDTNQKRNELTDYALELIHHKARKLVGTAGFTEDDVDDVKQELTLDLLQRLPKFDPAKATHNTFVARLVERKICNLIRHRTQELRDHRREACSLNDDIDVGEDEPKQRLVTISQDDHDLRSGKYRRPASEREDLQLDISSVLANLPAKLRRAGELLMTMTVAQVARRLGVPRGTFYETHVAPLRAALEARGLQDYL